MSETLPARFQPKLVRRFFSVYNHVYSNYPPIGFYFLPYMVGLKPSTAAARIKDGALAITRGLVRFPEILDLELFAERWACYQVAFNDRLVNIELRKSGDKPPEIGGLLDNEPALAVVSASDPQAITSLALLLSRRILVGRVKIQGTLDEQFQIDLTNRFDIALIPEPDKTTTMI